MEAAFAVMFKKDHDISSHGRSVIQLNMEVRDYVQQKYNFLGDSRVVAEVQWQLTSGGTLKKVKYFER